MKLIFCIILLFISISSQAQTWNEIFKQKKTQKKYLLQQIVAMKVYARYLKDGYKIASKGIYSIQSFTNCEFNLHDAFFRSLASVNPMIANNGKVVDIIDWQKSIKKQFSSLSNVTNLSQHKDYFENVRDKIFKECEF